MNKYQTKAKKFANYPIIGNTPLVYLGWGIAGEAGEVVDKIKKIYRDKNGVLGIEEKADLLKELGDVLWYVSEIARSLDATLQDVADLNIDKLEDRYQRGTLGGSGDNR